MMSYSKAKKIDMLTSNSRIICKYLEIPSIVLLRGVNRKFKDKIDVVIKTLITGDAAGTYSQGFQFKNVSLSSNPIKFLEEIFKDNKKFKADLSSDLSYFDHSSHDYDQHPLKTFDAKLREKCEENGEKGVFWSSTGTKTNKATEYLTLAFQSDVLGVVAGIEVEFYKEISFLGMNSFFPSASISIKLSMLPEAHSNVLWPGGIEPKTTSLTFNIAEMGLTPKNRRVNLKFPQPCLAKYIRIEFVNKIAIQTQDNEHYVAVQSIKPYGKALKSGQNQAVQEAIYKWLATPKKSPKEEELVRFQQEFGLEAAPARKEILDLNYIREVLFNRLLILRKDSFQSALGLIRNYPFLRYDSRLSTAIESQTERGSYFKDVKEFGSLTPAESKTFFEEWTEGSFYRCIIICSSKHSSEAKKIQSLRDTINQLIVLLGKSDGILTSPYFEIDHSFFSHEVYHALEGLGAETHPAVLDLFNNYLFTAYFVHRNRLMLMTQHVMQTILTTNIKS